MSTKIRYSNTVYNVHISGDVYRSYLQIPLAHHARALRQIGVRMRLDKVLDAEGRRVVQSAAAFSFLGGEDRSSLRCSGYWAGIVIAAGVHLLRCNHNQNGEVVRTTESSKHDSSHYDKKNRRKWIKKQNREKFYECYHTKRAIRLPNCRGR